MNEWARDLEVGIGDHDSSKAQNLMDEHNHFMSQANQEAERIIRQFGQKALNLGLPKPYYD